MPISVFVKLWLHFQILPIHGLPAMPVVQSQMASSSKCYISSPGGLKPTVPQIRTKKQNFASASILTTQIRYTIGSHTSQRSSIVNCRCVWAINISKLTVSSSNYMYWASHCLHMSRTGSALACNACRNRSIFNYRSYII